MGVVSHLVVKVSANVTEFDKGLATLEKRWQRAGARMQSLGADLSKGLTLPLVAFAGLTVKAASDFESSFAGVRKTVKATEDEFAKLSAGFRAMAKEIPVSVNELNKIGELGGQLGIQTENLLDFTRVIADMAVTTNLSVEDAALGMARFGSITQMSEKDFSRLGSTIVALGNEFEVLESEILEFGLRLAGTAAPLGITEAQILGISAAFGAVGVQAERGGTAVQKALNNMNMAVSTGDAGQLARLGAVSGMSGTDFSTLFKTDAAEAFTRVIEGVGAAGSQGAAILQTLGLDDERQIGAFLSLAGAGDKLRESIRLASVEWEKNTALTEEAEERYKTFASQVTILKNKLYDVAITIGGELIESLKRMMPAIESVLKGVAGAAEWFSKLPQPIQTSVFAFATLGAAAGPLLYAFGTLTKVAGGLIAALRLIPGATTAGAIALGGLRTAGLVAGTSVTALGGAVGALAAVGTFGLYKVGQAFSDLWDTIERGDSVWAFLTKKEDDNFIRRWLGLSKGIDELAQIRAEGLNTAGDVRLSPMAGIGADAAALGGDAGAQRLIQQELDLAAAAEKAAAAAKQHAEQIANLRKELTGQNAVGAAQDMTQALRGLDISQLLPEKQVQIFQTVSEGIRALEAAGKPVPKVMRDMAMATRQAAIEAGTLGTKLDTTPLTDTSEAARRLHDALAELRQNIQSKIPMDAILPANLDAEARAAADALGELATNLSRLEDEKAQRIQSLETLGGSFRDFGASIGGVAGDIAGGVGSIIQAFALLERSSDQAFTSMDRASAVAGGAAAVWQATGGNQSRTQGALSGAMAGLQAGLNPALMGPTLGWSAVIGAGAGLAIGAMRGGENQEDINQGREMTEEWAQSMSAQFDRLASGADRLTTSNSDLARANVVVRETYEEMGIGADVAAVHMAALQQTQGGSSASVQAALDRINDLLEEHQRITENWAAGVARLNEGFALRAEGFSARMELAVTLEDDLQRAMATTGTSQSDLITQTQNLHTATENLGREFQLMGQYALTAFSTTFQQSGSLIGSLHAIKGPLDALILAQQQFGFEGSAAVTRLLGIREVVSANEDVFLSLEGMNQMMAGLQQATLLTHADMQLFGQDAVLAFDTLTGRGIAANDALAFMQPTLQGLWEGQQQFGLFTDEATQALIDQAVQAGIVGDDHKSINEQIVTAMLGVQTAVEGVEAAILRLPAAFADVAAAAAQPMPFLDAHTREYDGLRDRILGYRDSYEQMREQERAIADLANPPATTTTTGPSGIHLPSGTRIPSFANEGIARKPTLAIVGDAPEPEYILRESTVEGLANGGRAGSVVVEQHFHGTVIGNSREFEETTTTAVLNAIERSAPQRGRARRLGLVK